MKLGDIFFLVDLEFGKIYFVYKNGVGRKGEFLRLVNWIVYLVIVKFV